jgi:hypothetical protein
MDGTSEVDSQGVSAHSRRVDVLVIALALAVVVLASWPAHSRARPGTAVAWALLPEPDGTR